MANFATERRTRGSLLSRAELRVACAKSTAGSQQRKPSLRRKEKYLKFVAKKVEERKAKALAKQKAKA